MAKKKKVDEGFSLAELASTLPNYFEDNKVVQTGVYALDNLLNGGIELGSFIQLLAEAGVGKSTICLELSKNLCEQGYYVLYLDSENSITKDMMDSTGISQVSDNFFLVKESTFDKAEEILDNFISTNKLSFIVVDSLPGLINPCFTNIGDKHISVTNNNTNNISGPMTKFMSKYKSLAASRNIGFILVNQNRNSVNMKTGTVLKAYGPKNVAYTSDVIIKISPIKSKEFRDFATLANGCKNGKALELEIVKSNKKAPGTAIVGFLKYGVGLIDIWNYIDILKKSGLVKQTGKYFSINWNGKEIKMEGISNFVEALIQEEFGLDSFKEMTSSGEITNDDFVITIDGLDNTDDFNVEDIDVTLE